MAFKGYAIIIGAMKSGTTTLHHLLSQHPEIAVSKKKETDFFVKNGPDVAAYEAIFPSLDKDVHAYCLDSSTSYAKHAAQSPIPSRIAELPGRKQLFYIMRNPVERIDSHIAHNVAKGRWDEVSYPRRRVVEVSSYAKQLKAYESVGLLSHIQLLDFEALCAEPVATLQRVHDVLGIEPIPPKDVKARNTRKISERLLSPAEADELARSLRSDVSELISRFGFEPAKAWGIV